MKTMNFSALQVREILSYLGQYGPLCSFFKEKQPPELSFIKILSLFLKTILPQLKLMNSRKILEEKSLCYKTIKGHWTLRARFLSWRNVLLSELSSFPPLAVYFSLHLFLHSSEGNEICWDADVSSHKGGLSQKGKITEQNSVSA